jgi:hypothetical protein
VKQVVPRVFLTATKGGAEYDSVILGLILALAEQGKSISCIVSGYNLEKAQVLRRLIGRYVRCISQDLLIPGRIISELALSSLGADFVLIIGEANNFEQDLEFANFLKAPVVLVCDRDEESYQGSYSDSRFSAFISYGRKEEEKKPLAIADLHINHELLQIPNGFSQSRPIVDLNRKLLSLVKVNLLKNLNIDLLNKILSLASEVRLSSQIEQKKLKLLWLMTLVFLYFFRIIVNC